MFERTLQDVVKGLRAQPTSEGRREFASLVLEECRKELASTDNSIKANAVLKISHLRMLSYDDRNRGDDNTSFHVIETMALSQFKYKRIGYLAASSILNADSAVLLLSTNSLRKDIQSMEPYQVGLALGSTSNFVSRELAKDLLQDVISVTTSSSKGYVRKRGTICLYRLCTRYPEGLREAYDALRSRLDDSDQSVISCAVNTVCELSRANPRNVLPLTPQLYQLLTSSGNNWLVIKVVKLYSSLLSVEPRLARKLLDPICHIIRTTSAKSLLYEGISTVTKALQHVSVRDEETKMKIESTVQLCAMKLKEFVRDQDQNLKYLGLVGFVELTKSYPFVAQEHKDLVILCLNDDDVTVRLRALELLAGMANKNTVAGIVSKLLEHLSKAPPGKFRDAVVRTCIEACLDETFERVPSCEWFIAVLMDLSRLGQGAHGELLSKNIVNVPMKVPSVRLFASTACSRLLFEKDCVIAPEVIAACAFVCCEYFEEDQVDNNKEKAKKIIETLLAWNLKEIFHFPLINESETSFSQVHCVLILNAFKLAIKVGLEDVALKSSEQLLKMQPISYKMYERLIWCKSWCGGGAEENKSFIYDYFGPVHAKAQKHVPIPEGLDLSLRKSSKSIKTTPGNKIFVSFRGKQQQQKQQWEPYGETTSSGKKERNTPFLSPDPSPYLLGSSSSKKTPTSAALVEKKIAEFMQKNPSPPPVEPSKLWSVDLNMSTTTSHKPVIVSAPTDLYASDDEDDKKKSQKKVTKDTLTLADVNLLEEEDERPSVRKEEFSNSLVVSSEAKKKKKKKSSKESKKKKVPEQSNNSETVQEADLIDFSEF